MIDCHSEHSANWSDSRKPVCALGLSVQVAGERPASQTASTRLNSDRRGDPTNELPVSHHEIESLLKTLSNIGRDIDGLHDLSKDDPEGNWKRRTVVSLSRLTANRTLPKFWFPRRNQKRLVGPQSAPPRQLTVNSDVERRAERTEMAPSVIDRMDGFQQDGYPTQTQRGERHG